MPHQIEGMPYNHNLNNLANSPINVQMLSQYLKGYNQQEANFLLEGFTKGFRIHYEGPRVSLDSKNLKSLNQNPDIVKQKIGKEVQAGRVAGPFFQRPFHNFRVSPIGLVPKKSPGEFRLIHHLSYPDGASVNDFIDAKFCSVQYTSFDEAIFMLQDLGNNCQLFKLDIQNAFRLLPIHPNDYDLLGFSFLDAYWVDKALPFGCSVSCRTFERFSSFLEHCVRSRMESGKLIHYLDDFLGGDKTADACQAVMQVFNRVASEINVPLALDKSEGPTEVIVFLGLELDSKEMVVRVPQEKVLEVIEKIQFVLAKEKVFLKVMQSLIGSLSFCCRAIAVGRPFCRRLINATCGVQKPYHRIRINNDVRLDLRMWLQFFQQYNGISVFHDRYWTTNDEIQLFSDSAGGEGRGFGIYFQGHWAYGSWPIAWHQQQVTKDITFLELFPIVAALFIWQDELRHRRLVFNSDNQSVVSIINSLTSKSNRVMSLVRLMTVKALQGNIIFKAAHVPGRKNLICDALSRFQLSRFRTLAPMSDANPSVVPDHLWKVLNEEPTNFFKLV